MTAHVLCVGGEDHDLRIPFMLALRGQGLRVTASGSAPAGPFTQAGLEYHPFRFERFVSPRADWSAVKAMATLLAGVRPDIVQSFDTKPNLLVPIAARNIGTIQVVRTINGMGWLYSSTAPAAVALRLIYRSFHRRAARSAAATIFQNQVDQDYFQRHAMALKESSRLIPGSGVDINAFFQALSSGASPAQLRHSLGLDAFEIVITVSRLSRQKGIATLLKAAALVYKQRPNVRFLLVGPRQSEGPFAISQAEIDCHAPYVVAVGRRTDIPSLLSIADVFAFPTEYREGVPRALLEAALAGIPIVTTSMPGCCDVIRHAWNGLVVPPRSPATLATSILELLHDRDRALEMARHAAELVRWEFGLDLTAARYAAVYRELLTEQRQRGPGAPKNFEAAPIGADFPTARDMPATASFGEQLIRSGS